MPAAFGQTSNATLVGDVLQLRSEVFNTSNTVKMVLPGTMPFTSAAFGRVTSATAARQIQFALRYRF